MESLATSLDSQTRQQVASNPNTPITTLLKLGVEFPQQFLNNPVLSLLFIADLNFAKTIPEDTLLSIVKQNDVPEFLIKIAANKNRNKLLHLAININAKTPKYILEQLIQSHEDEVVEATWLHINWAGEIHQDWQGVIRESLQMRIEQEEAENKKSLLPDFAKLGLLTDVVIEAIELLPLEHYSFNRKILLLQDLSQHPYTPLKTLERFAHSDYPQVRETVSRNPRISLEILEKLAQDPIESVRKAVADNLRISTKIFQYSSRDLCVGMHTEIAENPLTPSQLLDLILRNNVPYIMTKVIIDNSAVTIYQSLARVDSALNMAKALIKNPQTPAAILQELIKRLNKRLADKNP